MLPPFDILKRTKDGSYIWLEAGHDLEGAKGRLHELSANAAGVYVIFDERTQLVVASVESRLG